MMSPLSRLGKDITSLGTSIAVQVPEYFSSYLMTLKDQLVITKSWWPSGKGVYECKTSPVVIISELPFRRLPLFL